MLSQVRSVFSRKNVPHPNASTGAPLVSVILASYNHERFIEESVHSVLDQTHTNIELIVVDDGSSDQTVSLLKKIHDPRLTVIALPENRRFHPRNTGLKKATGEFIAFQNSDDTWSPDKLATQVALLQKDPEIGASFAAPTFIDEQGNDLAESWAHGLFTKKNLTQREWLWQFFLGKNSFCLSSALVRQSVFQKIGVFNEALVQLSDFDLWLRIAAVSKLSVHHRPLSSMRIISGQNLSGPSPENMRRGIIELQEVLTHFTEPHVLQQIDAYLPKRKTRENGFDPIISQGKLALKCWELGGPSHVFFAHQLLSKIFASREDKEKILAYFGADFMKQYIQTKSRIEIELHD